MPERKQYPQSHEGEETRARFKVSFCVVCHAVRYVIRPSPSFNYNLIIERTRIQMTALSTFVSLLNIDALLSDCTSVVTRYYGAPAEIRLNVCRSDF